MIETKSQKIIELSQKKIALQKHATNLEGFQTRQKQIAEAVAAIRPIIAALRAFRQRGITSFDISNRANTLLTNLTEAEAKFQENPEWIIDQKNFDYKKFKLNIDGLKNALKNQLNQAWKTYLTQHMPSTNQQILNVLAQIEEFKPTVERIRQIDTKIQQVEFPQNSEDFDKLDGLIDMLRQSWNSLNSDEVPADVLSFLKVVAAQGAPLDMLTLEVKDWLTKHKISKSLRIRLT